MHKATVFILKYLHFVKGPESAVRHFPLREIVKKYSTIYYFSLNVVAQLYPVKKNQYCTTVILQKDSFFYEAGQTHALMDLKMRMDVLKQSS